MKTKTKTKVMRHGMSGMFATAAIAVTLFSAPALADEVKIKLSGEMEVPPVATMASGSGSIMVNTDMTVSGSVTTTGVAGTMAHIHHGKAGMNGPVLVNLAKSGDNVWMVPPGAKLTEAQYKAFMDGDLYVNVHSAENKGGEVRGQLMPAMPKSSGH